MSDLLDAVGSLPVQETGFAVLIALVVLLTLLAVAFALYALVARIATERRERQREALRERWEEPVLLALADPELLSDVWDRVEHDEELEFINFALGYARRVRGVERDVLKRAARPYLARLVERVHDHRVEIRTRAVQTLGTLGLPIYEDKVVGALDDPSPLVAMVAARGLAREAPRYAPMILRRLSRFDGWSRSFLASMLAGMGSEAAPALREAFGRVREVPWVRAIAADALRLLGDLEAGDLAAEVIEVEGDRELLAAALRLLASVGRPEHVTVVRVRCASPDFVIRAHALTALGTLGEEEDVHRLRSAVQDPSPWVAIHAARGLYEAGGEKELRKLARSDRARAELADQVLLEEGRTRGLEA